MKAVWVWLRQLASLLANRPATRSTLYSFWRQPGDGNRPKDYLAAGNERSAFLVGLVHRRVKTGAAILEIGCNCGRNLEALRKAGYENLAGVELSADAVGVLIDAYPILARKAMIWAAPIEEVIRDFGDGQFELVFTMATLQHLHPRSEWVFREIARIARQVITIEDETSRSWRSVPRDYGKVFERLGMRWVAARSCAFVPGLGPRFVARVYRGAEWEQN